MTSAKLLKKYFWFLRAFQSGPISKKELEARWQRASENVDNEYDIPRSSFFHMRNEIESLFDVDIQCNERGEYYVKESFRETDEFRRWLLSSLAIDSSFSNYESMHKRIMFEKIPGGTHFLQPIIDAMHDNYQVIIRYDSFKHEPREFIFSPYAIRIYKQRWYAIGESSDHPNEVRTYAFDRFVQVSTTNRLFTIPKSFDLEKYYKDYYGMTIGEADDVQDIVVRIAKKGVRYLRSLPLHHSQKEINTTEEYSDFQFHLAPNFEFKQEIYSRGTEAEVLSPQSLRDEFAETFAALNKRYNG